MASSDAVQKQWDLGATTFGSIEKLRELIGVASEDNVQPQALLAFCSLGTLVHPTPDLIGSAVDTLGGTNNVKLEKLKLVIGFKQGGTAQYLRKSTPGVAAFLLLSALKMWCEDEDIGDILHRIALKSGVIATLPASSQQFCDIVNAVSGQSRRIIPVNHMVYVGDAVLTAGIDATVKEVIYKEISNETVANILSLVLCGLHNSNVKRMSLNGAHAAMWLIGLLTWLFPGDVCVTTANLLVIGTYDSRLAIDLRPLNNEEYEWEFLEWKEELPLRKLILAGDIPLNKMCVSRMVTKHRLQCRYSLTDPQVAFVGRLAGAVICHLAERATIYMDASKTPEYDGFAYRVPSERAPTIPLLEVAGTWYCEEYPTLMQQYGWSIDDLRPSQQELCNVHPNWKTFPKTVDFAITDFMVDCLIPTAVSLYGPFLSGSVMEDCMISIMDIACDALVFIARDTASSWECTEAMTTSSDAFHTPSIIGDILNDRPFEIDKLNTEIRRRLCWNLFDWSYNMPIVSRHGYVVCLSIILEPSLRQRSALSLNIISGSIMRGANRFSAVRELNDNPYEIFQTAGPFQLFAEGEFVKPRPLPAHQQVDLEVLSTTSRTVLIIKSHLIFNAATAVSSNDGLSKVKGTDQGRRIASMFTWVSIVDRLATARHMRDDELITPREEEALARSLASSRPEMLDRLQWILPCSSHRTTHPKAKRANKLIARTCQDLMTSLYQLSRANTFSVIQNGVSLVKCIAVAEQWADSWVIIT